MFFFFSWGSKWKYEAPVGGLRVEKSCPDCGVRGRFFEVIPKKYFSIFWIPVAPTESKKPLLECPNCHERFYILQSDYLSAIKDATESKTKDNKVIHLPQDPIDVCIVPCENCGQKLKVPKNDKMLRITCPSCKNTFHFHKGEKIYKATPIDPHRKLEPSKKAWCQKHLYLLIGATIIWGIIICFILLPEHKTNIEPTYTTPPLQSQTLTPEKPPSKFSPLPVEPAEPLNPKRLPNGSSPYGPGIRSGHSTLTVDNGTDTDAFMQVMRLMDKAQYVRNFYIQSNSKWTEERLPTGQYVIKVAFGKDWNPKSRKQALTVPGRTHLFNFHRSFSKTEPFEIAETTTGYTEMSMTLHKVPLGNFKSHEISEEDFMKTLSDFR